MSDERDGHTVRRRTAADTSLLAVLDRFRRAGWGANHVNDDGRLRCGACRSISSPASIQVGAKHRTEGASDPQDSLYVFGFACPICGERGTVVAGFGPMASEPDQQLIAALSDDGDAVDPVANLP